MNYHRFVDDIVITVSAHHTKEGWAERTLQRLQEQLTPLGVQLNMEKTKVVNLIERDSFGFLGFDPRYTRNKKGTNNFVLLTPKKKARLEIKAEIRRLIKHNGSTFMTDLIKTINAKLSGWVNYFRVGQFKWCI